MYKVSCPCGCGKTTHAMNYCAWGARAGEKFIIAQPSIELVTASFKSFREKYHDVQAVAIHSGTCHNVATELRDATKEADGGFVIFCTHTGLLQTPWIENKEEWHVIFDESPSPIWLAKFNLKRNRDKILPLLAVTPADSGRYHEISIIDDGALTDIARDSAYGVYSEPLKDLARKLLSGYWHIYVLRDQWKKVTEKQVKNDELLIFGLLDLAIFDGYRELTFMSANFNDTIISLYCSAQGRTFKPHRKGILDRIAYDEHLNGELLSIYYATGQDWSKKLRDAKIISEGRECTVNDEIVDAAKSLFGDETFVKLMNKDLLRHDPFGDNGELLPHMSHGLNKFQHMHNAVIIPALSATPPFYAFLEQMAGLDAALVSRAIYCEQVYQAVMRISLRNLADKSLCKVVVPDQRAAFYLNRLFPGSQVERLSIALAPDAVSAPQAGGRPSQYETPEQRAFVKAKQKAEGMRRTRWRARHAVVQNSYIGNNRFCTTVSTSDACSNPFPHKAHGFAISLWDSRAATPRPARDWEPTYEHHFINQRLYTTDEFFVYIQRRSDTTQSADKSENNLFMPSLMAFDQDPGHGHSKKNHVVTQGIVLDFDHSELTPDDIHAALPFRMLAYASWNHKPDDRKFRVCVPTLPMTYDASEAVRRMCVRQIEEAYPHKKHGADMSKMGSVALFFLPSIRPNSFVSTYDGDEFDHVAWLKACPHDIVDDCVRLSPNTPQPQPDEMPPAPPASPVQPPEVEAQHKSSIKDRAVQTWRKKGWEKGKGRTQFWSLYRTLRDKAELPDYEIETILWDEAQYAHNPTERRADIPKLLRL